ncbi:MAG TPA: hypothetical protein VGF99_06390, partial [Myxococcota bacterium]
GNRYTEAALYRPRKLDAIVAEIAAYQPAALPQPVHSDALCAVIVPVMRRPRAAARFMESLTASRADAVVYAVADRDDDATIDAWSTAGATVMICGTGSTFARKVQWGYERTVEPWLFLVGDDVAFTPGWLDAAIAAAGPTFGLVAVNDGARDDLDEHACHPLLRRHYVDTRGASWDGPRTIAHTGYMHWYVDNEWSIVARNRDAFVAAPDAVVEHLHPLFGKGDNDLVYELGQSHRVHDRRLWRRRLRDHTPTRVGAR